MRSLPESLKDDESFVGRLRDLKRESISRACRRLVDSCMEADDVVSFGKLYGLRSTLLHEGAVDTDFVSERAQAEDLVARLLAAVMTD